MGLDEAAVSRLAAATVSLGIGRSGTLISRDGLVLSSATAVAGCVDRLRREGALSDRPFVSDPVRRGPECTELEAEIRVDVREVGPALAAARTAGAPDPEAAMLSACREASPDRRCQLVAHGAETQLIARRSLGPPRLVFWPGRAAAELGGDAVDWRLPRLRLDAAILWVPVGPSGSPAELRIARDPPELNEAVVWAHHPGQSLREASTLEAEIFTEEILPTLARRSPPESDLRALAAHAPELLRIHRRHELRALASARSRGGAHAIAFARGRGAFRALPWSEWVRADPSSSGAWSGALGLSEAEVPPLDPEAEAYEDARPERRAALGESPEGAGDLRLSRGRVVVATREENWRLPWSRFLRTADLLGETLSIPRPPPWRTELALGFEIEGDAGPFVTGGPVLTESGGLVGIMGRGDLRQLGGYYGYAPGTRVAVTSVHALELYLLRVVKAKKLALELRY